MEKMKKKQIWREFFNGIGNNRRSQTLENFFVFCGIDAGVSRNNCAELIKCRVTFHAHIKRHIKRIRSGEKSVAFDVSLQIAVDIANCVIVFARIRLENFKNHIVFAEPMSGENRFCLFRFFASDEA